MRTCPRRLRPARVRPTRRFAGGPPARPAAFGDTVRFTVDYHGRIRQGYGLYFFKADGRPHRPQQVYSGGGTDGNPRWLPTWGGAGATRRRGS